MLANTSHFAWPAMFPAAITIFVLGFIVASFATKRLKWSLLVAFLKSAAFVVYFGVVFDGTYTFKDDWSYLEGGVSLLGQGVSVTNLLAHLPELYEIGGNQFVYYLFNADSFRLFGKAYYSPVAINIILSFVAAAFMAAVSRKALGFSKSLATGLFVFMVLHPDVMAWSTIMNGKDTLVLTGTMVIVYAVSLFGEKRYLQAVMLAGVTGLIIFFTRYYVPLILLIALFGALIVSSLERRHPSLWLLVPAGLVGVISALGIEGLVYAYERVQAGFVNPLYGIPRAVLTPIPFHTTEQYTFLDLPQVFHWALFPALAYGVVRVWQHATLTSRFVVVYFLLMILLYGVFYDLQGPRQRFQLVGLVALFQFYGGLGLLKQILSPARTPKYGRSISAIRAGHP